MRDLYIIGFILLLPFSGLHFQKTLIMPIVMDVELADPPTEKRPIIGRREITIDASNYLGGGHSLETISSLYHDDVYSQLLNLVGIDSEILMIDTNEIDPKRLVELERFVEGAILADGYLGQANMFLLRKKMRAQNSARFSPLANELCDEYGVDNLVLIMVKANNFYDKRATIDKFRGSLSVYCALMNGNSGNIYKLKDYHKGPTIRDADKSPAMIKREDIIDKTIKFVSSLLKI